MDKLKRLQELEERGRVLEEEGEVSNWKRYNSDMDRLTEEYTNYTKVKVEREKDNDNLSVGEEFADKLLFMQGKNRVF